MPGEDHPDDGGPATVGVDGKVSLYQQAPLAIFKLGAAEVSRSFESTPVCVSGQTTTSRSFAQNEAHDLLTTTALDVFTIKAVRGTGVEMKLDEVARFQKALLDTPTRLAGVAEIEHRDNAFELVDGVKSSDDPSCGTRFAAGVVAARFLALGLRIEFASAEDKASYVAQFKDVTAVARADSSLAAFFAEHPAKISTHVLVSTGQVERVRPRVDAVRCSSADLAACQRSFQDFTELASDWPTLEGGNESIDDLTVPGASFGVYDVLARSYTDL